MSTYEGSIKFSAEVDTHGAEDDLKKFGDEAGKASPQLNNFSKAEKNASDNAEAMEKTAKQASLAVAALGAAMVAGGAAAIHASGEFESSYSQVQTIMDTEQTSVEAMREDILDLSISSGIAATDVSAAVYQAISGSVETSKAAGFVADANKLAIAGFTSLGNATDVLTTTLNAYKLSAEDVAGVSNVLIQTQNLGKTSVDELAGSIGKVIPTAAAYNVNLANLSTAYVELTRNGIATAESTTYINGMLNELGKSGSNVSKIIMEQTGKSFGQLMQDGESLGNVLGILMNSVGGNAEAFANLWGSAEAGKAALAITGAGIEDFNSVLGDMQGQMSGVASTTDDAYATMTQTSEFIDKKFDVSLQNLGIAVGDKLAPKWDKIKLSIADTITGLTDFVKEHPAVVDAAIGLAAGIAVFAGGLAIAGGTIDGIKVKFQELTAAMDANPWILLASAIAALTVYGISYYESMETATDRNQALVQSMEEVNRVLGEGKQAYEDTIAETEMASNIANNYLDRLDELDAKTVKTKEDHAEYNRILRLLSDTVPELAGYIDLENGKLKASTDELRANTQAWKDNAIAQAKQKYLEDMYAAAAKAQIDLDVARSKIQDYADAFYQAQAYKAEVLGSGASKLYGEGRAAIDASYDALLAYNQQIQLVNESEKTLADLNSEIAKTEETLGLAAEDAGGKMEESGKKATSSHRELITVLTEAQMKVAEYGDSWESEASALSDAWATAHESISKSINGQISLFADFTDTMDTMEKKTKDDTKKMISSLDSQLKFMDTYAQNMQRAAEMGVDEGLLASLNDGSVESAEILAGIVAGTEKQIAEMNEKWRDVQKGKETFADALTEYDLEVKSHKDTMVNIAKRAGIEIPQDMTAGLLNGLGSFQAALDRYGSAFDRMQRNARAKMASLGLPGYATGTSYAKPGVAIVGEAGPELVVFSGGEQVINATETNRILTDAERTSARAATTPMPYTFTAGNGLGGAPSASGSHDMVITVPLYIDGREFARATADEMGEQLLYD